MGILLTESEAAAAGSGTSMIVMLLVYAVLIGAMWFFFMRPQKKEQKRVAAMLSNLETGDCVLTTSGFYGIQKHSRNRVVLLSQFIFLVFDISKNLIKIA